MSTEQDLQTLIARLKAAQDAFKEFGNEATKQDKDKVKSLNDNTKAQSENTEVHEDFADRVKKYSGAAKDVITNVASIGNEVRTNRDDFTSLNPAIRTVGSVAGQMGSGAGKVVSAIGDVVSAASWLGGPLTKIGGTVVGMGLNAVGDFMDKNSKQIAELGVQYAQFATGEMQNVFKTFQTISRVGALGERGMTGLYEDAIKAGLDINNYSQVVGNNAQSLAKIGGTTEKGAKLLTELSGETYSTKEKFLALGMSYEEQFDLQAKFLERNRVLGQVQTDDTKRLAEASDGYLDQLNEISRITGVSRQQANSILEKQMANSRMNAALQIATEKDKTGTIAKGMSDMDAYFAGRGLDRISQGIQDGFAGANTEAARELAVISKGQSQILAEKVQSGEMTGQEAAAQLQDSIKAYYAEMGGDKWLAQSGDRLGAITNIQNDLIRVTKMNKFDAKDLKDQQQLVQDNKNTQDQTTENVVDAQKALRDMSIGFDKIVKDKVFPTATQSLEKFTDMMDAFVEKATGNTSQRQQRKATKQAGGVPSTPAEGQPQGGTVTGEALIGKPLSGVNESLAQRLSKAASDYFAATGKKVTVTSAVRSPEEQQKLYNDYITGKSKYPAAKPGHSKHDRGLAVDINSADANAMAGMGILAKNGLGRPVANDPVHIEVVSAATGGAFSGPTSGFPAVLHGTEAVVPLPNGRSIPVEMKSSGDSNSAQRAQILTEQNAIIDQIIAYAKQSNYSGKKLAAYKAN